MRCAVVLALGDPRSSDAGMWIDAVAWLRQELAEIGFHVVVIDGEDVEGDLSHALESVTTQDELLVHISGRLMTRGVVSTAAGRWVPLRTLGERLAVRTGGAVSVFAELIHNDGPDRTVGGEHVASILGDLGVRAHGFAAMVGVRSTPASVEGLALTRLCIDAARNAGHAGALVSWEVYHGALRMPESPACAQSFKFVRSGAEEGVSAPRRTPTPLPPPEPLPSFALEEPSLSETEPLPSFPLEPSSASEAGALPRSLDERIAYATELSQWRHVVELRRERLLGMESPRMRARELVAIARVLQADLDDAEGALGALDEAHRADPTRVGVLQALRRGYERLGRWQEAFDVIGALANLTAEATDRADLCFAQAQIAAEKLQDPAQALTALYAALQIHPAHEHALALFGQLATTRPTPVEQPSSAGDVVGPEREAREIELQPARSENGQESTFDAADPNAHANAFDLHRREGRTDAALLAALALEELGAADVDQQIFVDQFRSVAPIRARGTLDSGGWDLLRMEGTNEALTALFAAVARAAVATRLEQLIAGKRLIALDPAKRLDKTSTASVVRSFQWAARVLGVPSPALYVVDDVPGDIAAVPARDPVTALSPAVLSGRSAKELAFLAGRHLTYYRPEHEVLLYFPTGEDLGRLLMATLDLATPRAWPGAQDRDVVSLRERIERQVSKAELALAADAGRRLTGPEHLGTSLVAWARGVELTAGRAGLLLCGDLATATASVRSESRSIAGLTPQDRRHDLIAFCSSPQHTELRSRFVVTAPESLQPPASPTQAAGDLA